MIYNEYAQLLETVNPETGEGRQLAHPTKVSVSETTGGGAAFGSPRRPSARLRLWLRSFR
jgi:hypothetical protein